MNAVTEPLVSIIVPIYNVEKYLDQCVASLIQQTHHNIEILLIDDGSPDNAPAICDAWQHKDERVHVLHKTNSGVSASRNAGLHAAKGEYVCFVDGDDWVEPDFVEYMLELQAKRNADIVASLCCFTSTDFHQRTQDEVSTINPQEAMELFLYPTIELGAWNKLYRRSFLTANNLEFITDFCAGEGLQFITLAASKANCVTVGQKKVYHYRTDNATSATTKPDVERQGIGAITTMQYICEHLDLSNPKVRKAYNWRLWSTYGYCLRQIIATHQEHVYRDLLRTCIHHRRSLALPMIAADISMKRKIIALLTFISPTVVAKLSLR